MPSPASRPIGSQVTLRRQDAILFLVSECALRSEGVNSALLDRNFFKGHLQMFLDSFAAHNSLGPNALWRLIAELLQDHAEETQSASPVAVNPPTVRVTRPVPLEHSTNCVTSRPLANESRTRSHNRSDSHNLSGSLTMPHGVKRLQSDILLEVQEAGEPFPDTALKLSSKRKKSTSGGTKTTEESASRQYTVRQCPGSITPDGMSIPCEVTFIYKTNSLIRHWDNKHRASFIINTPDGGTPQDGMKYRCLPGCLKQFKDPVLLNKHQLKKHTAILDNSTVASSHAPAQSQVANGAGVSLLDTSGTNNAQPPLHSGDDIHLQPDHLAGNFDTYQLSPGNGFHILGTGAESYLGFDPALSTSSTPGLYGEQNA